MARPRNEGPTPAELEMLRVLWERGPSTVREVLEALNSSRKRAYTSVMSLMNVMVEKGLLSRAPPGRAFVYNAKVTRRKTRSQMLKDMLDRVFDGSANLVVAHLLEQAKPSEEELEEIRRTVADFLDQEGSE